METKDKIRETAFQMFTGIGYSGVTMDQIARRCKVGKATLYKYFPSKEALILSCIDYFTDRIKVEVDNVIRNPNLAPEQKITGFLVPIVQFVSRINSNVLDDIQRNVPVAYEKIDMKRKEMILSNIIRIVDEGKEKGILREDLNGMLVAHILIGAVTQMSTPQILDEIDLPLGQLLKMIMSIIWEGCLRKEG